MPVKSFGGLDSLFSYFERIAEHWDEEYRHVWRKSPGEPFTPKEFAVGQNRYKKWVQDCRKRNASLAWEVHFVREHYREERRRQQAEEAQTPEAAHSQWLASIR